MSAATAEGVRRASFDPYAQAAPAPAWRFLMHLNPLAKIAAPAPAMLLLMFVRDLATPGVFLALAALLLVVGAPMSGRIATAVFAGLPLFVLAIGIGFSLWTDPARVSHEVVVFRLGAYTLYGGALEIGFATALRLGSIVMLALLGGLTTTGPDLARSLVQQLRVPYRVGYTAIAAFRFVPRFRHELDVIRAAHRVRGTVGRPGPISALKRNLGYVVPLLAGAIRHAERVALAMDARAFGAYPSRTERYLVPFRIRDVCFVVAFWAASAVVFVTTFPWGIS